MLLAEQNARSALAIADRGYVVENGRITMSGPARTLLGSSEVAERYLGGGTASPAGGTDASLAERLRACIATPG